LEKITNLRNTTEIVVRFSEVDSLSIVWHGHYVKYLEDGREGFGAEYDLSYLGVYSKGYVIPIVKLDIDYKKPLKYGDKISIETSYWDCDAAKLIFSYTLKNASNEIIATARTIQVFVKEGELCLNIPDFIIEWKNKHLKV
jgi:acyl-CoA thioester hydrolase